VRGLPFLTTLSNRNNSYSGSQSQGPSGPTPYYSRSVKPTNKKERNYRYIRNMLRWLDDNGYEKLALSIRNCGSQSVSMGCEKNYHEYYTRLFCHSILCPRCGKKGSKAHRRRVSRTYEKLNWCECLGNVVLTLPPALKGILLAEFFKLGGNFVMEYFNVEGCIGFFHPLGEKLLSIHPHIQFLFYVPEEKKFVAKEKLRKFSSAWADLLRSAHPELDVPDVVQVSYNYRDTPGKISHTISYSGRKAFIRPSEFLDIPDDMKHYLARRRGKRLARGFGCLGDRNIKEFLSTMFRLNRSSFRDKKLMDISYMLYNKVCPCCGDPLSFKGTSLHRVINYDEAQQGLYPAPREMGNLSELLPDLFVWEYTRDAILEKWSENDFYEFYKTTS